ncbi:hypothetical protein Tco_1311072 [Tanacetum coccineum]
MFEVRWDLEKFYWLSSKGVVLEISRRVKGADEAAFISVDVDAGGATTTDIGLKAGQGSGTMHKTPTRPHDSPLLRVYILGSDEGSLQQNELMDLVTKLTDRVEVLENDMQQKKKVYSSALTNSSLIVEKKLENDAEKKELRDSMDVVPRDDIAIDIESLATNTQ